MTTTYFYKSKTISVLLAFFLGGLGMHRFYLGNVLGGFAYMCAFVASFYFPEAALPLSLVLLVDFIWILCMKRDYFKRVDRVTE